MINQIKRPGLTLIVVAFVVASFFSFTHKIFQNSKADESNIQNSEKLKFKLDTIKTGLKIPWGMVILPDGDMLVSDLNGQIKVIRDGKVLPQPIEGVPEIFRKAQGGLFDLELHPKYKKNGWIYISYAAKSDNPAEKGGNTGIIRAKLKDNKLIEKQVIFQAKDYTDKGVHFGARMEFDKDGYLYFSVGERGEMERAQRLDTYNGKVYRLNDDGSIPKDNPFLSVEGAKKEAYSYGHRNPQGLALNPWTGAIWETEHGPMGGDELNVIRKGKNYGWPAITYGIDYDSTIISKDTVKEGMEQPVKFWRPSIAPSNLVFVNSSKYPQWKGNILVCAMKFQYVERCEIEGEKVIHKEKLLEKIGRVRNILQGPDGYIYLAIDGGKILRIVPVK